MKHIRSKLVILATSSSFLAMAGDAIAAPEKKSSHQKTSIIQLEER